MTTGQCRSDLIQFYKDFQQEKMWASKMIDSYAKLPSGILEGNLINFGDFDECLSINYATNHTLIANNTNLHLKNKIKDDEYVIKGKYCLASLNFTKSTYNVTLPSSFLPAIWKNNSQEHLLNGIHKYSALGICIPASCDHKNLKNLLNYFDNLDYFVSVDFKDELCVTNESKPLEIRHKIGIVFFTIILQIIIMSTLYDYFYIQLSNTYGNKQLKQKLPTISQVLSSFSLIKNSKKLFTMTETNTNQINCIQGIKTLSIFWIILGHTFLFETIASTNLLQIIKWSLQLQSTFVQSAYYAVETFLVVSGVLSGYIFCNTTAVSNFRWKKVPNMYCHRLVRLAPALYAMLIFYICLGDKIGFGPYKLLLNSFETEKCLQKFPSDVLFVQNYYQTRLDCLGTMHAWYLTIEMQLITILPVFVYLLTLNTKYFRFGALFMVITSMFWTFCAIYFKEIPITIEELATTNKFGDYHQYYYYPVHTRMVSWFIGLLIGQWMTEQRFDNLKLQNRTVYIIWSTWTIVIGLLFVTQGHMKSDFWGYGTIAIYLSLSRPLFALCISWLIFACVKGYSGVVNAFLSLKIFNFFSKIVFCMYLVHQPIILFFTGEKRTPLYFRNVTGVFEFTGYLSISIFFAIIWTLCFEIPVIRLEKCFTKRNHVSMDLIQLK